MLNFEASPFADLAETSQGKALWNYLNSEEALACLETTTFLKRPALEGLQPKLLEKFGDSLDEKSPTGDRWRQMAGKMVRQVMEANNYTLDQTGVGLRAAKIPRQIRGVLEEIVEEQEYERN